MPVELRLEQPEGSLRVMGRELVVPPQELTEASVLIELAPDDLAGGSTPVTVGVYSDGRPLETLETRFIGPRNDRR